MWREERQRSTGGGGGFEDPRTYLNDLLISDRSILPPIFILHFSTMCISARPSPPSAVTTKTCWRCFGAPSCFLTLAGRVIG